MLPAGRLVLVKAPMFAVSAWFGRSKIRSSIPMKKPPVIRLPKIKAKSRGPLETWHGGGDIEIHWYARSLQIAAKTLVGKLERDQNAKTIWDICPIVLLYREALEIH